MENEEVQTEGMEMPEVEAPVETEATPAEDAAAE